jgi:thymidylate kinase
MIVALEGIDASGKETQAHLLQRWALDCLSFTTAEVQDFPDYKKVSGVVIKSILEAGYEKALRGLHPMDQAAALQCLFTMNRFEHFDKLGDYSKSLRDLLILDRYYASGVVYGSADGLSLEWLLDIHAPLPTAEAWILVDITVDESVRRRPDRRDMYEKDLEKLNDVRYRYLHLFQETMPTREPQRWHVIDGTGTQMEVHKRIVDIVEELA